MFALHFVFFFSVHTDGSICLFCSCCSLYRGLSTSCLESCCMYEAQEMTKERERERGVSRVSGGGRTRGSLTFFFFWLLQRGFLFTARYSVVGAYCSTKNINTEYLLHTLRTNKCVWCLPLSMTHCHTTLRGPEVQLSDAILAAEKCSQKKKKIDNSNSG